MLRRCRLASSARLGFGGHLRALRAGRLTTPDLVDASKLRIETGDLTSASVAAVAAQDDVCAVVVRSRVRWGSFADLPERLEAAGYVVADEDDLGRRLYLKQPCSPT